MKNLKNPKVFVPLAIILIALGTFTFITISNHDGHGYSDHGHEH